MKLPNQKTRKILIALLASVLSILLLGDSSARDDIVMLFSRNDPLWHDVLSVSDGDTFTVAIDGIEETVRMIGVDTPETHHPSRPVQCFGESASTFTKELLEYEEVRLEADPQNTNRDRYQRLLRYVYKRDGTLVNAEIIKQGYGFAYTTFPFEKQAEFKQYERTAEAQTRGLWGGCTIELDNGYPQTNPAVDSQ